MPWRSSGLSIALALLGAGATACALPRTGLGAGDGGPGVHPPRDAGVIDATAPPDAPTAPDAGAGDAGAPVDDGGPIDGGGTDAGPPPCTAIYYRDADGDGHGNPAAPLAGCMPPPGYAAAGDDCDDGNGTIHPGAAEACDTIDQDCDGIRDDHLTMCGVCPLVIHDGWPYVFCNASVRWTEAEGICNVAGYHLVTIHDGAEDTWVATTARAYNPTAWWIGYQDLDDDHVYTWIAGASGYVGWAMSEPNDDGGHENCALTAWYGTGTTSWNDGDCDQRFPFVCSVAR